MPKPSKYSKPPKRWRANGEIPAQDATVYFIVVTEDSGWYELHKGVFKSVQLDQRGTVQWFEVREGKRGWWLHPSRVFSGAAAKSDGVREADALNIWLSNLNPL